MAIYNLDKTENYDINGRILNNYIHNNFSLLLELIIPLI